MSPGTVLANSEMREWKMKDGSAMMAEIFEVEESKSQVTLRDQEGKLHPIEVAKLDDLNRAWLLEWIEMNEELGEKVKELGGRFTRRVALGEGLTTGYYVYEPVSVVKEGKIGPLMMLFCPSGQPIRFLLRHVEAAEKAGITIVTGDHFRNGLPQEIAIQRYRAVVASLQKELPYPQDRFFLGGTSGGALLSFRLSAEVPEHVVAGVYSNGGWLGHRHEAERPYPAMRAAIVNGDRDRAANFYNEGMIKILQDRQCVLSIFAFEGGHQVPPSSVQLKSFRWLLGETD
jgi:hypothetical protein